MKKFCMEIPDEAAAFLEEQEASPFGKTAAVAMLLFPFIYDQKLTFKRAAAMMEISKDDLREIYDFYGMNEGVATGVEHLESIKRKYHLGHTGKSEN